MGRVSSIQFYSGFFNFFNFAKPPNQTVKTEPLSRESYSVIAIQCRIAMQKDLWLLIKRDNIRNLEKPESEANHMTIWLAISGCILSRSDYGSTKWGQPHNWLVTLCRQQKPENDLTNTSSQIGHFGITIPEREELFCMMSDHYTSTMGLMK